MKDVYLWFYCLPLWEAIAIILVATVVFVYLRQRFGDRAWWNAAAICLLAVWMLVLVWTTLMNRSMDPSGQQTALVPLVSYWKLLRGGNPEILRVNLMNMILFYPAGLLLSSLLPEHWNTRRSLLVILAVCCTVSVCVEFLQYWFEAGLAETDDVIHNTLGGAAGAIASWIPIRLTLKKQ